jgi:hypothetical protein
MNDILMELEEAYRQKYGNRITTIERLEWMSDNEWNEIKWYYGCVCNYDMKWDNLNDYDAWCKRILKK